jgi:2-polyprenyl-3-methyl-5-hydroxy-6-metoxy-1,4-benzoquinol methylase
MKHNIEYIFTDKYNNNSWKGSESRSGPGSSLKSTRKFLSVLEKFVKENNIKTIIDIGCGDFNWMKNFDFSLIDKYVGVDIVKSLIESNNLNFNNDKISFIHGNIIEYKIERYDLVICKDVLFHLSFDDALNVIENIKLSNSDVLVSTTFYDFDNFNIKSGDWRPINLETHPFNFKNYIELYKNIEDRNDGFVNKSAGFWKINEL